MTQILKRGTALLLAAFISGLSLCAVTVPASMLDGNYTCRLEAGKYKVAEISSRITVQTGVTFSYNNQLGEYQIQIRKVDFRDAPLENLLSEVFKPHDIMWRETEGMIALYKAEPENQVAAKVNETVAEPRERRVAGIVRDEEGEPLPGVGVLLPSGEGTLTDADGAYLTDDIGDAETLLFSSIGYRDQTVQIGNRTVIDVVMRLDKKLLEEVVVLGYTSQKKNELSSSVVTLSSDKLTDVTTNDLGNMLQGKAAGVLVMNDSGQPGADSKIRIRGTGSISAGAAPLYVVDGVAGGSFNPNDVETLTILKDASATALYGAAAAGGVIVVTTKSAKDEDVTVSLKASVGAKRALRGRFSPMDSRELYDFQKTVYSPALFAIQRPKSLLEQDFNWVDASFRTGIVQDYYASVTGKVGKVKYFTSLGYYDEQGSLINTNHKKTSARINLSAPITDKLTMMVRFNYNWMKTQGTSSYVTLECAYNTLPWDNPYDVNTGEILYIDSAKRPDNGKNWYSHDKYNMLHNELYNYSKDKGENLTTDVQLNWNICDWLMFSTINRFSTANSGYDHFVDPRTKSPSYSNGYIYSSSSNNRSWGTTNLLKANKSFGDHGVNGVLGFECGGGNTRQLWASGTDMPAGQTSLSNSEMQSIGSFEFNSFAWALLAQAQYSYKGRYLLSASVRYDETSKFAPKARGGWFPGVSAAWVIDKESWMQNQNVVSLLKLRAGYGKTGNNAIQDFLWQDTYSLASQYQGIVAAVLQRRENPNLGWEEAYMASLGLDIEFTPGISLTLDLYDTRNTNLLLAVPQAPSTGFFEFMDNVGTVNNKGIEIAFSAKLLEMKGVRWDAGFNMGFNKNTVVHLPQGEFLQTANSVNQQVKEGQDIYSWFMPKWVGVDPQTGDPNWEVINEDGSRGVTNVYAEATPQVVGKATPIMQGGLNTSISWKGLSLSMTGSYVAGNKIFNYARISMDSDGAYTDRNMMSHDNGLGWSRWEKPGDIATHPKASLGGNKSAHGISSRFLEDGSFFRLKNVTLAYALPQKAIEKMRMKGLRIYVSADNIATASRFSGMDPEVSLEGTPWSLAGTYMNNYPIPFSVVGGVEITF